MENVKERIVTIINSILNDSSIGDFDYDTSIIDELQLDSIQLLQLISSLEREFNIFFSGEDLVLDHFETVNSIAEVIERS